MSGIDGTDKTETNIESKLPICPEHCDNVRDFRDALDARAEQLDSRMDRYDRANEYAEAMAEKKSPDELRSGKKLAEDKLDADRAAFEDACFGDHEGMRPQERQEMIGEAKRDWEYSRQNVHLYDMALDFQNGDRIPQETAGDNPYAEGRVMDEASLEQLREKQAINDDFDARHENGERTTETPDESAPVDIPDAADEKSGEPSTFRKAVGAVGIGLSLWGMQNALTRPIDLDAPPTEEPPQITEFDPDSPSDWLSLAEAFSKIAGGEITKTDPPEDPVKIEDLPPDGDDKKGNK